MLAERIGFVEQHQIVPLRPLRLVNRQRVAVCELVGFTPDLRTEYESARVVVVPMRFGAGVKVKCIEALQYGVPVVSTSVGAEGLGLHDSRAVIVADDPREFAASLLRLYEQPDAAAPAQVVAAPTLVRETPPPVRRLVGDLSDHARVLFQLDLGPRPVERLP